MVDYSLVLLNVFKKNIINGSWFGYGVKLQGSYNVFENNKIFKFDCGLCTRTYNLVYNNRVDVKNVGISG